MRIAIALIAIAIFAAPAMAGEPSSIPAGLCRANASPLTFGVVDAIEDIPIEATGTIRVSCTGSMGIQVSVALMDSRAAGVHPLADEAGAPGVELFLDAGRHLRWGDGLSGTARIELRVPGDGRPIEVPVYASLALPQGVKGGRYSRSLLLQVDATPP